MLMKAVTDNMSQLICTFIYTNAAFMLLDKGSLFCSGRNIYIYFQVRMMKG